MGLLTGVLLAENLCDRMPSTPIIVISNINVDGIASNVKERVVNLQNVVFVKKATFKPQYLADAIVGLLEHGKRIEERKRLLASLFPPWS